MKEHTAVVHRLDIEFLYTAVEYYSTSTVRRHWHALTQLRSIHLTNKVAEVQAAIEEMRKEMEIVDGIRLNKIEREICNVAGDVQDIWQNLETARVDVKTCLYGHPAFKEWQKNDEPGLIVPHGTTIASERTDLSWISPRAVSFVNGFRELFQDDTPVLLRYFCRIVDDFNNREQRTPSRGIVASFIFQILRSEHGKVVLRSEDLYAELKCDIERANEIAADRTTEGVKRLFGILDSALKNAGVQRVVLVVDRVD
ncbi:hypothetical protein K458DRAFT_456755 [Lentithecium fluviatile CBS 122367]|uniref:DUF7708 domain-containing protein n=1 Tax=Lentithecium fluviatile CBS 122367 TaxID=1168545 RepID=A0A6G1IUP0_9PLEO|nr:hypothetical protein K458DRAFT_456755 [Lentithecium fluviatile CBS 122367]